MQAEYQLVFVDSHKQPIRGVQLRVESTCGRECYKYPVSDFIWDAIPTTDEKGAMVLHHVNSPVEFGGKVAYLFWLIPVGTRDSPTYICRFFFEEREVFRCDFRDLRHLGEDAHQKVTRTWRWDEFTSSYPYALDGLAPQTDAHEELRECSREERIARQAIESANSAHQGAASEELEFSVYRRTIIVD